VSRLPFEVATGPFILPVRATASQQLLRQILDTSFRALRPTYPKRLITFFSNTHPATPLKKVAATVFGRLADQNEAGAAVHLRTGFGGGKTHTLIALYHLAKNIGNTTMGTELLAAAGRPIQIVVAGVDGEKPDATVFARYEEVVTHSLWAELAYQLGCKAGYDIMASVDHPETAPDGALIRDSLPVRIAVQLNNNAGNCERV
jgi:predicted AAA+ superfamily ATPase